MSASGKPLLFETPWDKRIFGFDTYELGEASEAALRATGDRRGHFTVRVDPLEDKALLGKFGFYYVDTLVQPFAAPERILFHDDPAASVRLSEDSARLRDVANGAFTFARFYKDRAIPRDLANRRYQAWLEELFSKGCVLDLLYGGETAGFLAFEKGKIILHTLDERHRGRGLGKVLWSAALRRMILDHPSEIVSSVSITNLAVMNLYVSLNFRFRNAKDVYHKSNGLPS